jgi:hypothetical protein
MAQKLKYDLAGLRFGQILVLKRVPGNKWFCQCDCGETKEVYGGSLRGGRTLSCGCHNRTVAAARAHDLTGRVVGRLTVVRRMPSLKWACRCSCGREVEVPHRALLKSETRSCGCLKVDVLRTLHRTHGKTRTRAHRIWVAMRQRCNNPNTARYKDYGGRGIVVCERWQNSFEAFLSDMGEPPSEDHSIDRIDNDLGYEPTNCRWATMVEQRNNQRRVTE